MTAPPGRPEDDDPYDTGASWLVMPFLPVKSKGGPYDDDAYCAGYEMGTLDAKLGRTTSDGWGNTLAIHAENQQQADLIAMRRGYVALFTEPEDGWVRMRLFPMQEITP